MQWLMIYGLVAVGLLAALTIGCAQALRGDALRLVAVAACAALWPVMAVGLLQYGAIRVIAGHLGRHTGAYPTPAIAEPEPATIPMVVNSLARLAQRIDVARPA